VAVTRVEVFIDWQNCYRSAQDAFGPGTNGNVNPNALARHLDATRLPDQAPGELTTVQIHSGIPSQRKSPTTYAARRRQHAAWKMLSSFVEIHTRTLATRRDPSGNEYAVEKGIDVALAIGMVRRVVFEKTCDVVVLVSADTDLLPALELIIQRRGVKAVEVATWDGPHRGPQPLAVAGHQVRQHRFDERLYRKLEDTTPYHLRRC
jgi:uncharacterized LabA/DUF88 family protein